MRPLDQCHGGLRIGGPDHAPSSARAKLSIVLANFYLGPDAQSPTLQGKRVCNHPMPYTAHNSFAIARSAIDVYLAFLRTGVCPS